MKFKLKHYYIIIFLLLISCSNDEKKVEVLKEKSLEAQMIEVYNQGMEEFERVDVIYAGKKFSEAELLSIGCDAILLSSEPYPFKERHIAEIKTLCKSCDEVSLIDGEKISWYGSRAIKGLEYLRAIASKESVYV